MPKVTNDALESQMEKAKKNTPLSFLVDFDRIFLLRVDATYRDTKKAFQLDSFVSEEHFGRRRLVLT